MTSASPNDGKDAIVAGAWSNAMNFTTLQGVKGKPFRFVNRDANFYTGFRTSSGETTASATTRHSVQSNSDCNYVEVYGKDALTPWKNYANYKSFGFNYLAISGTSGSTYRIQNVISNKVGGGLLASHAQAAYTYRKMFQNFNRVDGNGKPSLDSSEASYNGHNGNTLTYLRDVAILHNAFINMGREPWQIEHCRRMHVYNVTSINNGLGSAGAGQNNCVQVHDSNGIVENCIFDGSPNLMNIFTHDVTFKNCYFRWTNGQKGYIGNAPINFPGSSTLNGRALTFDGCYFHADYSGGTVAAVNDVVEPTANVEYRNCFFSTNITAINTDSRPGGFTNSIIGTISTNGNTKIAMTAPTYLSTDITNVNFGCLTNNMWYQLGMGYRTPLKSTVKPNIVDALETNVTKLVAYNTAFSGITGLSSTNIFHLQDGSRVTLPVTWAVGNYNKTGATRTYTLVGTPTSGSSYQNVMGVLAEQDITIGTAPSPTKVILVNFGAAAATYQASGFWNNIFADNPSGVITVKGDNSSTTLASLRNTENTLTGYQINCDSLMSGGNVGADASGAGVFPDNVIKDEWYNPAGSGSRGFKITGLNNALTYKIELLGSAATYLSGSQIADYSVASSGRTSVNIKGNISSLLVWNAVSPTSNEIVVRVTKNTNLAAVSAVRISYTP